MISIHRGTSLRIKSTLCNPPPLPENKVDNSLYLPSRITAIANWTAIGWLNNWTTQKTMYVYISLYPEIKHRGRGSFILSLLTQLSQRSKYMRCALLFSSWDGRQQVLEFHCSGIAKYDRCTLFFSSKWAQQTLAWRRKEANLLLRIYKRTKVAPGNHVTTYFSATKPLFASCWTGRTNAARSNHHYHKTTMQVERQDEGKDK